jgi:hypothetical protein
MNSNNNNLITTQHQQLLSQLIHIENKKKIQLSTSTLASLLQTPLQSRSLLTDLNDPFQQKIKRFKTSHKKTNHVCLKEFFILFEIIFIFLFRLTN